MSYICGKSHNNIVHNSSCRYIKLIAEKNRKEFYTLKDAAKAGYVQCKYCSFIQKYLRKESEELENYCESNGIFFYFNRNDGSLDVISKESTWKIIVNGYKRYIWLYHKNAHGYHYNDLVPGFHSQKIIRSSIMGYMEYISSHDEYRIKNPYKRNRKIKPSRQEAAFKYGPKGNKRYKIERQRYKAEMLEYMKYENAAY